MAGTSKKRSLLRLVGAMQQQGRPAPRPMGPLAWQNEALTGVAEVRPAQPLEEILCQLIGQLTVFLLVLALANTSIIS